MGGLSRRIRKGCVTRGLCNSARSLSTRLCWRRSTHWARSFHLLSMVSLSLRQAAEDIDCSGHNWECKFRFVGERTLDFHVNETNKDGNVLESKGTASHRRKYSHSEENLS